MVIPSRFVSNLTMYTQAYACELHHIESFLRFYMEATLGSSEFGVNSLFGDRADFVVGIKLMPFDTSRIIPNTSKNKINVADIEVPLSGTPVFDITTYSNSGNDTKLLFTYEWLSVKGMELQEQHLKHFYDYNPYTTIEIYLPYYGFANLNTNDVMNKDIRVRYAIDILSGDASIFIETRNDLQDTNYITIHMCECNVSVDIPFGSSNSYERSISNLMTGINVGLGLLAGGATVAGGFAISGMLASAGAGYTVSAMTSSASNIASGVSKTSTGVSNTINSIIQNNQRSYSGGKGGSGYNKMYMDTQPYLLIKRPSIYFPKNYYKYYGRPLLETKWLSSLEGFTIVEDFHFECINDAGQFEVVGIIDTELKEIEMLLKNGIIL